MRSKNMKKIVAFLLVFSLTLGFVIPSSSASTNYEGGLLDKIITAHGIDNYVATLAITDNDDSTFLTLSTRANGDNMHEARTPLKRTDTSHITSYKLKADSGIYLSFHDYTGKLLKQITTPDVTGALVNVDVTGVEYVMVYNSTQTPKKVYELNIYGTIDNNIPENLVSNKSNSSVILTWAGDNPPHITYRVKRSEQKGGPYLTISDNMTSTNFTDTTVQEGKTYYYVIASNFGVTRESLLSNEVMASFEAPGRALLTITLSNKIEKEYDLSLLEVASFLSWYDARVEGNGPARYTFVKTWNKGPFKSRTEYVIFDKIETFTIDEYIINE